MERKSCIHGVCEQFNNSFLWEHSSMDHVEIEALSVEYGYVDVRETLHKFVRTDTLISMVVAPYTVSIYFSELMAVRR